MDAVRQPLVGGFTA